MAPTDVRNEALLSAARRDVEEDRKLQQFD